MDTVTIGTLSRRQIADPTIRRLVDEVSDVMKLEIVQAMMSGRTPDSFTLTRHEPDGTIGRSRIADSVAKVVLERFSKRSSAEQQTLRAHATRAFDGAPALRARARELDVNVASDRYVLTQIDFGSRFRAVGLPTKGHDLIGTFTRPGSFGILPSLLEGLDGSNGVGTGGAALNTGVRFQVHAVKCINETTGDPGKDNIAMGGMAIAADETESLIQEFLIGKFRAGDEVSFDPPKVLKSFDVEATFPQVFAACVSLTEKDTGGFSKFLTDLFHSIKVELDAILAAAGAYVGTKIGGALGGTVGGPIGLIIGAVAGAILGALVGWLVATFKDDIFEPQMSLARLDSADATFEGGALESPEAFSFVDFGGQYRVDCSWALQR